MLNVYDNTKSIYKEDGIRKELIIKFPSLDITVTNDSIVKGSFKLDEAIQSGSSLECVGCIASSLSVKIVGLTDKIIKSTKIEAYIKAGETEEIPLFHGYVDSAKKDANRKIKTITAYDVLYTLSEKDVSEWYNTHGTTTVSLLLTELLNKYSVQYNSTSISRMVNADVVAFCGLYKTASNMSALDLIKNICQLNGCFGKINRYGKFDCIYLQTSSWQEGELYPGGDVYPTQYFFPGYNDGSQNSSNILNFYEKVTYEDYVVKPIERVILRESSNDDSPIEYGEGTNKYIVQANIFIFNQTETARREIARKIYDKVHGLYYTPFSSTNNGLPYIECGDPIVYPDVTKSQREYSINVQFYIFSRTLTGEQFLRDSYEADGDEYQTEFITDISTSLSDIENKLDDLEERVSDLENGESGDNWTVESVYELPETGSEKTLYLLIFPTKWGV